MPRNDFHELVGAPRKALHPLREAEVQLCTPPLRHLAVGDVPHQDVFERILLVVPDRRHLQVCDEVTPLQLRETGERVLERRRV